MVYLDNAASTKVSPLISNFLIETYNNNFANQEGIHKEAYNIRQRILQAEKSISQSLTNEENGVFFTSSGTDALHLIVKNPMFNSGNIVTTAVEHSALHSAIRMYNDNVRIVRIKNNGTVDLEHLEQLLDKETTLVAIHHIHSETGVIQDLILINKIIRKFAINAKFLSDTIQSACKVNIPWKSAQLDFALIAAHKIGAPAGCAIIYKKDKQITNYFVNLRKKYHSVGRVEPALILTFAKACEEAEKNRAVLYSDTVKLNSLLRQNLSEIKLSNNSKIIFPIDKNSASPYIINFIIPNYQAAILVRALSEELIEHLKVIIKEY